MGGARQSVFSSQLAGFWRGRASELEAEVQVKRRMLVEEASRALGHVGEMSSRGWKGVEVGWDGGRLWRRTGTRLRWKPVGRCWKRGVLGESTNERGVCNRY